MGKYLQQAGFAVVDRAYFLTIYGTPGIGKTTFAANAPDVIFVGPETGTARLRVKRFPKPENFQELVDQLKELIFEEHPFKSLALDSLDWVESLIHADVCRQEGVANIEQVGGGFNKGYIYAMRGWEYLRKLLEDLRDKRNMNVILIAHSHVKTVNDPFTNTSYDRYEMKMHKKAWELMIEASDCVLFAKLKIATEGKEGKKHKAYGDGSRVVYTQERPGFVAKNRYSLPYCMPLDFHVFDEAVKRGSLEKINETLANIEELMTQVPDIADKVRESVNQAKDNPEQLSIIENRLRTRIQGDK